jgi:hypothetical protein
MQAKRKLINWQDFPLQQQQHLQLQRQQHQQIGQKIRVKIPKTKKSKIGNALFIYFLAISIGSSSVSKYFNIA